MSEETILDETAIEKLQIIRRANAGVLACAQLLAEHSTNKDCCAARPGVYIQFEPNQAMGLRFAIEACATVIDHEMYGYFDDLGVGWQDEICAEATEEGVLMADLQSGKINFDEFKKNSGLPDSLQ